MQRGLGLAEEVVLALGYSLQAIQLSHPAMELFLLIKECFYIPWHFFVLLLCSDSSWEDECFYWVPSKKGAPGGEKRTCKGPGVGGSLAHLKSRMRVSEARRVVNQESNKTESGDGARCEASEAVGWSLGSILSAMGSQGKDLKHRGNMT